jgi:hypothetical protein
MTDTSSLICVHDNLVETSLIVDCESMVAGFIGDHVIVAKLQLRHGGQGVTSMLLLHIPLSLNSVQWFQCGLGPFKIHPNLSILPVG